MDTVTLQPPRVGLYARVSTQRQEQEATIESQVREIEQYAQSHAYAIDPRYRFLDNGYSGDTLIRPELDRLRDDVRATPRPFDVLLVHEKSRTARRYLYRELVEDELRQAGIEIVYITQPSRGDSPEDRLLDGVQGLFAEYERLKIGERMRRGKRFKIEGGHLWRVPYGYRYVKPVEGQRHGHIEIVEDRAAIVRDIFTWIASGRSSMWVTDDLNRRGIPSPKGCAWRDSVVRSLIHNPIYSGSAAWNRVQTCEPTRSNLKYRKRRKSSYRQRPEDEWVRVPAPAIITVELQDTAVAMLRRNERTASRNLKRRYLLRSLLRCGMTNNETGNLCLRTMSSTGNSHNREETAREHRCTRQYYVSGGQRVWCRNHIKAHVVEPLVWEHLVQLLLQPAVLREQLQEVDASASDAAARIQRDLNDATCAAEAIQDKLDRLLDLHLEGRLDDATYARRQVALVAGRATAQERVRQLQADLHEAASHRPHWGDPTAFCARIRSELDDISHPDAFDRRRILIELLVTDVIVYPDAIEIVGAIPCLDDRAASGMPGGAANTHLLLDLLNVDVDVLDVHAQHLVDGGGDAVLNGRAGTDHVDPLRHHDVEVDVDGVLAHGEADAARHVVARACEERMARHLAHRDDAGDGRRGEVHDGRQHLGRDAHRPVDLGHDAPSSRAVSHRRSAIYP